MNALLLKILDRYDLDKPILMQDKMDIIWDKSEAKKKELRKKGGDAAALTKDNDNHLLVKLKMGKRKIERKNTNEMQMRIYKRLLEEIESRKVPHLSKYNASP